MRIGYRYCTGTVTGSRLGLRQHRLRGVQGGRHPPCSGCVVVSPASVALARRPLHARRAVLHDLDATLSGRLRRGRRSRPSPPLASRAHRGLWPHIVAAPPAVTRLPRAPSFRRPPSSRRGEALWEREGAGSGSPGVVFSESAAGFGKGPTPLIGRLRWRGRAFVFSNRF